jgi:hypothetical protein
VQVEPVQLQKHLSSVKKRTMFFSFSTSLAEYVYKIEGAAAGADIPSSAKLHASQPQMADAFYADIAAAEVADWLMGLAVSLAAGWAGV